jgi:RNA polymerase sigma-70 factor (ECF subfamily)
VSPSYGYAYIRLEQFCDALSRAVQPLAIDSHLTPFWTGQTRVLSIDRPVSLRGISFLNSMTISERSKNDGSGPSDDLLLESVRGKNQRAMADVFDRYGGMVYSVALRLLKDKEQAEDVMQDVFFQLWMKPDAFVQGRGSLGAWLMVVTRNRAIDKIRRRKANESPDDVVLLSRTNLASEAERNVLMERVRDVLENLPPEQQKTLELAYFEGLSHSEIAEQTGDPLGTVKTRIRLALMSLRKALAA